MLVTGLFHIDFVLGGLLLKGILMFSLCRGGTQGALHIGGVIVLEEIFASFRILFEGYWLVWSCYHLGQYTPLTSWLLFWVRGVGVHGVWPVG